MGASGKAEKAAMSESGITEATLEIQGLQDEGPPECS
jgi:hypothetical protein